LGSHAHTRQAKVESGKKKTERKKGRHKHKNRQTKTPISV